MEDIERPAARLGIAAISLDGSLGLVNPILLFLLGAFDGFKPRLDQLRLSIG
jgi:hypothetical protein